PALMEPTYRTRPSPSAICLALGTRASNSIVKPGGSLSLSSGKSAVHALLMNAASTTLSNILVKGIRPPLRPPRAADHATRPERALCSRRLQDTHMAQGIANLQHLPIQLVGTDSLGEKLALAQAAFEHQVPAALQIRGR